MTIIITGLLFIIIGLRIMGVGGYVGGIGLAIFILSSIFTISWVAGYIYNWVY